MNDTDQALLRRAFAVAQQSRELGDHPFGAVLADKDGHVILEQGNGFSSEGRDMTAHAERLLATRACTSFSQEYLVTCTLYSSAEPCAMCAGAIYWAGIGRVVYGQSEESLKRMTGAHAEKSDARPAVPGRFLPPDNERSTWSAPLLEDEAAQLQSAFWDDRARASGES